MWLITPLGFFSVVRKKGDTHLTVRARVAGDLDRLRERYLPDLSPVKAHAGTDYPYRATVSARSWALALSDMGRDIDYSNFKDEVAKVQGHDRAHVYANVWTALMGLEKLPGPSKAAPAARPARAAGAVKPGAAGGPIVHPRRNDNGEEVIIKIPSAPTPHATWSDAHAIATVVPRGTAPEESNLVPSALNGVSTAPWRDAPRTDEQWTQVPGQLAGLVEPALRRVSGKEPAAGAVIVEPDGRVWIVSPTNAFGGYKRTFPKGRASASMPLQATAIKEVFEESGLRIEITGFLLDTERSTTITRFYAARRVGGDPTEMGWEAQAVSLVPMSALAGLLNVSGDHKIVDRLAEFLDAGR